MSKITFAIWATLGLALATLLIGVRGLDSWQPHEFAVYYLMLGWMGSGVYHRYVQKSTA